MLIFLICIILFHCCYVEPYSSFDDLIKSFITTTTTTTTTTIRSTATPYLTTVNNTSIKAPQILASSIANSTALIIEGVLVVLIVMLKFIHKIVTNGCHVK
ncbi:unnamed protein product, partial [Adineta steineri]